MRVRQEVPLEWTLTFFQSGRRVSLAKELWYPYWTMVSHKLMTSLHYSVAKFNLEKVWLEPFAGRGHFRAACGVPCSVLHGLCVLLASCVRTCSLLWVRFMLVACFCSHDTLPFIGNSICDGKYLHWCHQFQSAWQLLLSELPWILACFA